MKCTTSSLHYYLNLHPQIAMSWNKERNFFIAEHNWPRGVRWYERHFKRGFAFCGESSPAYTHHPHFRGVAARMHDLLPTARLIYLVRDPIERILSHYLHAVRATRRTGAWKKPSITCRTTGM